MRISSSVPRSLLLAGAFVGVLSYGAAAQTAAQQPAPNLLALVPGLPPLPNLDLNLLGSPPR